MFGTFRAEDDERERIGLTSRHKKHNEHSTRNHYKPKYEICKLIVGSIINKLNKFS